jgi:hypothetical protein
MLPAVSGRSSSTTTRRVTSCRPTAEPEIPPPRGTRRVASRATRAELPGPGRAGDRGLLQAGPERRDRFHRPAFADWQSACRRPAHQSGCRHLPHGSGGPRQPDRRSRSEQFVRCGLYGGPGVHRGRLHRRLGRSSADSALASDGHRRIDVSRVRSGLERTGHDHDPRRERPARSLHCRRHGLERRDLGRSWRRWLPGSTRPLLRPPPRLPHAGHRSGHRDPVIPVSSTMRGPLRFESRGPRSSRSRSRLPVARAHVGGQHTLAQA